MYIFVWRISIKTHKGHCPKCGSLIINADDTPTDYVCVDAKKVNDSERILFCGGCREKGKTFILGTVKEVPDSYKDYFLDAGKMYKDMDWDEIQKAVANKARGDNANAKEFREVKNKLDQANIEISRLNGTIREMKIRHEKVIKEKDKMIQTLQKEINGLEADLKRMEKESIGE